MTSPERKFSTTVTTISSSNLDEIFDKNITFFKKIILWHSLTLDQHEDFPGWNMFTWFFFVCSAFLFHVGFLFIETLVSFSMEFPSYLWVSPLIVITVWAMVWIVSTFYTETKGPIGLGDEFSWLVWGALNKQRERSQGFSAPQDAARDTAHLRSLSSR